MADISRAEVEKVRDWMLERKSYWMYAAPPADIRGANLERADVWAAAAEGMDHLLENGRWTS